MEHEHTFQLAKSSEILRPALAYSFPIPIAYSSSKGHGFYPAHQADPKLVWPTMKTP